MASSSQFPTLLRRTSFASFDPAITRVYTSTPHSISQHGDFGLKYPVLREKRLRNIKVSNLDMGRFLGSDWRSAEAEAGFVAAYGTGRVPWKSQEEFSAERYATRKSRSAFEDLFDEEYPAPKDRGIEAEEMMQDVNTMTEKQFHEYLETVRKYRKQGLATFLSHQSPSAREKLRLPEDKTLVNMAQKRQMTDEDTIIFRVGMARALVDDTRSKTVYSRPHALNGLSYSRLPAVAASTSAIHTHPGRALDRDQGPRTRVINKARSRDTNKPWVVSIGGYTAATSNEGEKVVDGSIISKGVDYTRGAGKQGQGRFTFKSAKISNPPRVVDHNKVLEGLAWTGRRKSTHNPYSVLNTAKFDILVQSVSDEQNNVLASVGTKEWVARDAQSEADDIRTHWDKAMGLLGPRNERQQGEASKRLRGYDRKQNSEAMEEQKNTIAGILARLGKRTAAKQG